MKNTLNFFSLFFFLFIGCSNGDLTEKQALDLVRNNPKNSDTYNLPIYYRDPEFALKVAAWGLEDLGMVQIKGPTHLFSDLPLITFTEKAKPYLLSTSEVDNKNGIQFVKLADRKINRITGIKKLDEVTREVQYEIVYTGITPFAKMTKKDLNRPTLITSVFRKEGNSWRILEKSQI